MSQYRGNPALWNQRLEVQSARERREAELAEIHEQIAAQRQAAAIEEAGLVVPEPRRKRTSTPTSEAQE